MIYLDYVILLSLHVFKIRSVFVSIDQEFNCISTPPKKQRELMLGSLKPLFCIFLKFVFSKEAPYDHQLQKYFIK